MTTNTEGNPNPGNSDPAANAPGTNSDPAANPGDKQEAQLLFDPAVTNGEKKEGEAKPGEGDGKDGDKKEGEGDKANEANAFDLTKLTLPEEMPIPEEDKTAFTEIAKDLKLDNAGAQKLVDFEVNRQKRSMEFWDNTKKGWRQETEKDPEIGGANLQKSVQAANALVKEFAGTPEQLEEFQNDLILLGLGQKKSFIRFCNNIAKHFGNDGLPGGGSPAAKQKSLAEVMWPNMPAS